MFIYLVNLHKLIGFRKLKNKLTSILFVTLSIGPCCCNALWSEVIYWYPLNVFIFRLLDKLLVICPNSDSCTEVSQRGNLEDHLRYRCEGTLVACQYAGAGCTFRGPNKKVREHQVDCPYKEEGKWHFTAFITTLMFLLNFL